MRKRDLAVASLALCAACDMAVAQPPVITKLEVVGNHAGRMMKLTVDGQLEFEGRGHLDPPGVVWTLNVRPGGEPAPI